MRVGPSHTIHAIGQYLARVDISDGIYYILPELYGRLRDSDTHTIWCSNCGRAGRKAEDSELIRSSSADELQPSINRLSRPTGAPLTLRGRLADPPRIFKVSY